MYTELFKMCYLHM